MSRPSLDDLDASPDADVRRRARLVADTLALGPTQAARKHGVTRQTAARWTARYRSGGAARLLEPARRRSSAEELRHAVLTAPLWMPTTKWSSRSIATALGISQSSVARFWEPMASGSEPAERVAAAARGHDPELLGFLVTRSHSVVVLRLTASAPGGGAPLRVDARAQRSFRTVLAADLVRDRAGDDPQDTREDVFWERVEASCGAGRALMAIASQPVPLPTAVAVPAACRDADEWLSLLAFLAGRGVAPPLPVVRDLETELRSWYREARGVFVWVSPVVAVGRATAPDAAVVKHGPDLRRPDPDRVLAHEIVATIGSAVVDGKLAGGDRITERYLAARLRTGRGQIRTALRLLERDGLLATSSRRGAVVPLPTVVDVVETYAARRALGTLVVRAAMRWSKSGRRRVAVALAAVEQNAARGDVYGTNVADMDFQDTLSEVSGLVRIGPMLRVLADQLRMFIAVMGLDYAFPVEGIAQEDRRVFEAIDSGSEEQVVEAWQAKIDGACQYMVEQLRAPGRRPVARA